MMKTILERFSVRRTCEQRKNLLVNPEIVALVLAKDLEGNTVLYEGDGVQLFHKMAVPAATEPDLEPILHGPRILSEPGMELGSTIGCSVGGSTIGHKYRFALELGYNYAQQNSLERMT